MSEDLDVSLVRKAAEQLGEHFDSVQIFASRHEATIEDGTISVNWGCGNEFARYGQVKMWINTEEK